VYVPVLEICNDLMVRDDVPQEGRGYSGGNWVMRAPHAVSTSKRASPKRQANRVPSTVGATSFGAISDPD